MSTTRQQPDFFEDLDEALGMAAEQLQHAGLRLAKVAGDPGGARLLGPSLSRRWVRRLHRWADEADDLAALLAKGGRLSP
jgi:hypothetical protein